MEVKSYLARLDNCSVCVSGTFAVVEGYLAVGETKLHGVWELSILERKYVVILTQPCLCTRHWLHEKGHLIIFHIRLCGRDVSCG